MCLLTCSIFCTPSTTLFPYSVVFTCCPPEPLERYVSTLISSFRISTSTSSASGKTATVAVDVWTRPWDSVSGTRSEEHTSELQSRGHLVCRLLLEKKK